MTNVCHKFHFFKVMI